MAVQPWHWPKPKPKSEPRPELKPEPEPALNPEPRVGAGTAPILGVVLLLTCAVALAVMGGPRGPDPHLTAAREIVARYERVTAEDLRDCENEAYRNALTQLDQVDPASSSAAEAGAWASEIRGRIETQRTRARIRSDEVAARQEREQKRDEGFFETQRRHRSDPVSLGAKCESTGTTDAHGATGAQDHQE